MISPWLGRHDYCLNVKDIHKSSPFYKNLGFAVVEGRIEEKWQVLSHGNFRVALYQGHIGKDLLNFRGGDISKIAEYLEKHNYPSRDLKKEEDGSMALSLSDPDGYEIYFNTFPDERVLEDQQNTLHLVYSTRPELVLGRVDLCLDVSDLSKSYQFYLDLGFTPVEGDIEKEYYILEYSNLRLGIFEKPELKEPAITMNFRGGDIKEIAKFLENKNYSLHQAYTQESDTSTSLSLFDPDGNFLYFNTHPSESHLFDEL